MQKFVATTKPTNIHLNLNCLIFLPKASTKCFNYLVNTHIISFSEILKRKLDIHCQNSVCRASFHVVVLHIKIPFDKILPPVKTFRNFKLQVTFM